MIKLPADVYVIQVETMRTKPCMTIIIAGASNREPGLDWLFRQEVENLQMSDIGVVSCAALPCDQTFEDKINLDMINHLIVGEHLKSPKVRDLLRQDSKHARPCFPLEKFPDLIQVLQDLRLNDARTYAEYIINFHAFREAIAYNETLKKLRIPYQGLERASQQHQFVGHNLRANPNFFQQDLPERITFMTQKICRDAVEKARGKNSIILCHVGILVAQRLAASVLDWIQTNETGCDIKVLPFICYSNSTRDTIEQYRQQIRDSQANDSAPIQALYPTFSTPIVELHEGADGQYYSKTIKNILALARRHVAANKVYLTEKMLKDIDAELISLDIAYKPPRSCCGCVVQ